MKCYYVHVPGWVYAANFYGKNEREARAAAREYLGVKGCQAGQQCGRDNIVLIKTVFDFNKALELGPYAWPGGYPLYFITADGAALSWQAAIEEQALIRDSIIDHPFNDDQWPTFTDSWRVVALEINYEDNDLYCDHTGIKIESAYGIANNEI